MRSSGCQLRERDVMQIAAGGWPGWWKARGTTARGALSSGQSGGENGSAE